MSHSYDFATMDLRDALDMAIQVEDEAKERYEEFAHQMQQHDSPEAGEFFAFMAKNEEKHGDELRIRRKDLFADQPIRVKSNPLDEIEAPDYGEVHAFMNVSAALKVAMDAEKKAWAFFNEALQHIDNAEVKELFTELRDEEVEHQEMVQEQMDKAPDDHIGKPEDFVDPPANQ